MKLPCLCLLLSATVLRAQVYGRPAVLRDVGIEQKMGAQVPLDIPFTDEEGKSTTLREFSGKPIVLALVYYQCPGLCDLVLNGIARTARALPFTVGKDYQFVAVSFDGRENYPLARAKKQSYLQDSQSTVTERGWHFLTGPDSSSRLLADTIGFHFTYDPVSNQFAHPSAIMILTPEGRVARYFYGIDYPVRDVKLGLIEASGGKIGSPIDAVQLFCFHYDPANGKYGLLILNVLKLAGLATLGSLATFMIVMFRRDLRGSRVKA